LQACDANLDGLRAHLSSCLQVAVANAQTPNLNTRLEAILQDAIIRKRQAKNIETINGADVLGIMVIAESSASSRDLLRDYGMTRFDCHLYISHGLRKGEEIPMLETDNESERGMLDVKILNDDYTPLDFVVDLVERLFELDREIAEERARCCDRRGAAVCGTYPSKVAVAKATEVMTIARAHEYPLRCVTAAVNTGPKPSETFLRTLRRVAAIADGRFATPEHLMLGLIDDPDAAAVMQACNVDVDELRAKLSSPLSNVEAMAVDVPPKSRHRLETFLASALEYAEFKGRNEFTGADVLLAILASIPPGPVAQLLCNHGINWRYAVWYMTYGLRKDEVPPSMVDNLGIPIWMLEPFVGDAKTSSKNLLVEKIELVGASSTMAPGLWFKHKTPEGEEVGRLFSTREADAEDKLYDQWKEFKDAWQIDESGEGLRATVSTLVTASRKVGLSISGLIIPEQKSAEGLLVKSTSLVWRAIVEQLSMDWSRAFEISAYNWEEIIAGAFHKAGFGQVVLTPRSGDFGRDVIAIRKGVGTIKIIGSVKAYKRGHLVTHDDVRALLGVLSGEQDASKGIITTTSDFAPRIRTDPFIKPFLPTRLELVNGEELRKWLSELTNT
jgi:restriction system protein